MEEVEDVPLKVTFNGALPTAVEEDTTAVGAVDEVGVVVEDVPDAGVMVNGKDGEGGLSVPSE